MEQHVSSTHQELATCLTMGMSCRDVERGTQKEKPLVTDDRFLSTFLGGPFLQASLFSHVPIDFFGNLSLKRVSRKIE